MISGIARTRSATMFRTKNSHTVFLCKKCVYIYFIIEINYFGE